MTLTFRTERKAYVTIIYQGPMCHGARGGQVTGNNYILKTLNILNSESKIFLTVVDQSVHHLTPYIVVMQWFRMGDAIRHLYFPYTHELLGLLAPAPWAIWIVKDLASLVHWIDWVHRKYLVNL